MKEARRGLAQQRTDAANTRQTIGTFIAAADEMTAISDQQAAESVTTQRLGADPASSLSDYNASIARAQQLGGEYDAKIDHFFQLGLGLFGFGGDQAQTASVRR